MISSEVFIFFNYLYLSVKVCICMCVCAPYMGCVWVPAEARSYHGARDEDNCEQPAMGAGNQTRTPGRAASALVLVKSHHLRGRSLLPFFVNQRVLLGDRVLS